MRSFGSDNNSGVHPRIIEAITGANSEHAIAYGDDRWTREAEECLRLLMDNRDIEPFFLFNGTGANVVALQACTLPFHSILSASTAHVAVDECGAPVKMAGAVLKEIATSDGKLTHDLVRPYLHGLVLEHPAQPNRISRA